MGLPNLTALAQFGGGGIGGGSGPTYEEIIEEIDFDKRARQDHRVKTFGNDLFGDGVDTHTGSLSFTQTDVSLPGNFDLPVALTRKLVQGHFHYDSSPEFGDWTYDVPRIHATVAEATGWTGPRCSNAFASMDKVLRNPNRGPGQPAEYTFPREAGNGIMLDGVSGGGHLLKRGSGTNAFPSNAIAVTTSHWYFTCITAQGSGNGEGFFGHAPDGSKYRFDKVVVGTARTQGQWYFDGNYTYRESALDDDAAPLPRERVQLMATEVTDVHGNWVKYDYDSSGRLTKIHASDGRAINLGYSGSNLRVSTVSTVDTIRGNNRTWTYNYTVASYSDMSVGYGYNKHILSSITGPEGLSWSFDTEPMGWFARPGHTCDGTGALGSGGTSNGDDVIMTHPHGTRGEFHIREAGHRQGPSSYHYRNIPCTGWVQTQRPTFGTPSQYDYHHEPQTAYSLRRKRLIIPVAGVIKQRTGSMSMSKT